MTVLAQGYSTRDVLAVIAERSKVRSFRYLSLSWYTASPLDRALAALWRAQSALRREIAR